MFQVQCRNSSSAFECAVSSNARKSGNQASEFESSNSSSTPAALGQHSDSVRAALGQHSNKHANIIQPLSSHQTAT
eukprot:3790279-Lingulodinium_polyedra.AAC.1